jgi:hypothetical protein
MIRFGSGTGMDHSRYAPLEQLVALTTDMLDSAPELACQICPDQRIFLKFKLVNGIKNILLYKMRVSYY